MNSPTYDIEALRIESVVEPLLAAQEAVSRLDERARHSPHREAWMQRMLFREACACQLAEGDLVHLEDLVLLDGFAFSGVSSMGLSSALHILKVWRAAERGEAARALSSPRPGLTGSAPLAGSETEVRDAHAPTVRSEQLEGWRRVQRETRHLPPLIAAAIAWDAWLALLPESRSAWRATLLAALALKARGLTRHLLLPIDIGWCLSKYRRDPRQDLTTRIGGFLAWAETTALHGHKEFDGLTLADRMLRSSLRSRRSNSRLPALIDLLLERPFVSASGQGSGCLAAGREHTAQGVGRSGPQAHGPQALQRLDDHGRSVRTRLQVCLALLPVGRAARILP